MLPQPKANKFIGSVTLPSADVRPTRFTSPASDDAKPSHHAQEITSEYISFDYRQKP